MKCKKCGNPGHNARTCGRESKSKKKAPSTVKAKGGASWLKKFAGKLEDSLTEEAPKEAAPPTAEAPAGEGEPFQDLQPVTLGGSADATEADTSTKETSTESGNASAASDASTESLPEESSKQPRVTVDNKDLAKMAGAAVEKATLAAGAYAVQRGYFAFGPDMAEIAGQAAAIIVKAQATRLDISSEEGAAYIILGITGTNGVQAFRAYLDEKRKKEATDATQRRAEQAARIQHQQANGVPPDAAARQREEEVRRAAGRADQGPVV